MRPARARALAKSLVDWYRRHRRDLPWRRTRDPYRVWVSEVMLQQTTVRAVVPYYRRFLRRFPTIRALARAPLPAVLAAWSGLGYYRRARHLHEAAGRVVRSHGGRFPRGPEEARALPGVGRYTAGAILSIAYGDPQPVVDGNVARVLSRLLLLRGDPRSPGGERRLWDLARLLVEEASSAGDLNQALMELGATICVPSAPDCPRCPLRRRCAARAAGVQRSIPAPRRLRAPVTLRHAVALVAREGRFLMRRRHATGLMDGLWEFPALRGAAGHGPRADDEQDRLRLRSLGTIARLRHSVTYRRLLVEVHRARLLGEPRGARYRWITPRAVRRLPTSSLVSKVLRAVQRRPGLTGLPRLC